MATDKQRQAARRNVEKAQSAARRRRTMANLSRAQLLRARDEKRRRRSGG